MPNAATEVGVARNKNATAILSGALREHAPQIDMQTPCHDADLLEQINFHGVSALLRQERAPLANGSPALRDANREAVLARAVWELRHKRIVARVIGALAAAGITSLVIKGTALAYLLYEDPSQRVRGDTDLLIQPENRERARDILLGLGFVTDTAVSGEVISYQHTYSLPVPEGGQHAIDLHWRINNSEVLASLLHYNELLEEAIAVPELCAQARAPGPLHAMLIACMHRAVHRQVPYFVDDTEHYSADRLIWLYDIHLLARNLSDDAWHRLVQCALAKGLASVTLDGLRSSVDHLGSPIPQFVLEELDIHPGEEPPARYLAGSRLQRARLDFAALGSPRRRFCYLRELLAPPRAYMKARYPEAGKCPLVLLYLYRAAGGLTRVLRSAPHRTVT